MQSKELARTEQLEPFITGLEYDVPLYEVSDEDLKSELAAEITDSTRLGQLLDGARADEIDLPERLGTNDAVIISIVQDSCASS